MFAVVLCSREGVRITTIDGLFYSVVLLGFKEIVRLTIPVDEGIDFLEV